MRPGQKKAALWGGSHACAAHTDATSNKSNSSISQLSLVRAALLNGEVLTPLDALDRFGTFRLAGIVFSLRRSGMPIATERLRVRTRRGSAMVASYRLEGGAP